MAPSEKWDLRFLSLAKEISTWSKDPSTKVGSVIVDYSNRVVSIGFNGFPRGVADDGAALADRETRLKMTLHAETNAILFAQRDLKGCTIYIYPLPPCAQCTAKIIQVGIEQVVWTGTIPERWMDDYLLATKMLKDAETTMQHYDRDLSKRWLQ